MLALRAAGNARPPRSIVGILYWRFGGKAAGEGLLAAALGLVTGGILGNLYERLGLPDL
ncbi:MAG: hypothetical protein WDZ48_06475 [Pirellulales bacterium]